MCVCDVGVCCDCEEFGSCVRQAVCGLDCVGIDVLGFV